MKNRVMQGDIRIGTLLVKRLTKQEFIVVAQFTRRRERHFVLEARRETRLSQMHKVEPAWNLRMQYTRKPKSSKRGGGGKSAK